MRYLLIGANGLIGRSLLRALAADSTVADDSVTVLDITPRPSHLLPPETARFSWLQGDVLDFANLERVVVERKTTGIVLLAGLLLSETAADPLHAVKINTSGLLHCLELAKLHALQQVVWCSSVQVYGSAPYYGGEGVWVDENSPKRPESLYGNCKDFCESLAAFYHKTKGVNSVGLRFSTVIGHGRTSGSNTYFCDTIENAARGQSSVLPYGDHLNNFVYVTDAARAILTCMQAKTFPSLIYNICAEKLYTNREVAGIISGIVPEVSIPCTPGDTEAKATPFSKPDKFIREMNFTYQYPLPVALQDYINIVQHTTKG